MEPPDPPTDPPEWPEREDGPCELCRRFRPLYDNATGERVELPGYEAPGVCTYDEWYPSLVDGAKLGSVQGCWVFEGRVHEPRY